MACYNEWGDSTSEFAGHNADLARLFIFRNFLAMLRLGTVLDSEDGDRCYLATSQK